MALHIAGSGRRGHESRGYARVALLSGTLALGRRRLGPCTSSACWAFNLCTQVIYDPLITIGSMLPSLAASFVALNADRPAPGSVPPSC